MATYTLANFRTKLRIDLKDSGALWSDAELDRGVERAVQDIDRFFPLEAVYDYTIDYSVSAESTTAPAVGTYVALGYKPIKPGSVTLTTDPAGTTYTINTDYTMDYANGKYTIIAAGSITEADSLLATYTKSRLGIDLSAIISDYVRIIGVEYPTGNVPQQFVSYNIWNNFMYIGSQKLGESQTQLTDKEHIAIWYEIPHTQPVAGIAGSYPAFMDEVICIGAAGYAMFIKAAQFEHQAVTDLASSRTTLASMVAVHTLIDTALDKVATYVTDADTALDAAVVQVVASAAALAKINDDSGRTYLTDADTALDAYVTAIAASGTALTAFITAIADSNTALDAFVTSIADSATALAKVDTYLAGASESTKALLAQIATDAASLRTAIGTAVDAANTSLDSVDLTAIATALDLADAALVKVITYLENNTNEDSKYWLTKITTDIADLRTAITTALTATNAYLDEVDSTDLAGSGSDGVEPVLKKYEDKINLVNVGDGVAALGAQYAAAWQGSASVRTNAALGYVQEAAQRLDNLRSYIEQAAGWGGIAFGFVNEAVNHISVASSYIARERTKVEQAMGYMSEANTRLSNLRGYIDQAAAYSGISDGFIAEARERATLASGYIAEARERTALAVGYIDEAGQRTTLAISYISEANQRVMIADRYLSEGGERTNAASAYITEANGRLGMSRAFVEEANSRIAEIDRYLSEASSYQNVAVQSMEVSDRFRVEATERRSEFWTILRDKSEYRKRVVSTPVTQPR